ncbi:hypothetical protein GGI12_001202 [Dipsacomyces acuminosporus]|nr:hypothetical protein GGI12_001202 [Dipsacomyces acuminosporus]
MPGVDYSAYCRLPAYMIVSYIPDWAVTLVSTALWAYLGIAKPHYQRFSVNDKSISYPYVPPNEQTVTVPMLFMLSIAVPAAVVAMAAFAFRKNMHDLHVGLLGLLLTVSLTLMFTNGLKNVVGRPRPSLLARCLPELPKDPLSDPPQGLSSIAICTQKDMAVLNEGFRSFPSGHTSLSFAGMTYLTYFLAGKLHVFDGRGHSVKSFAVFFPLLVACIVGATRVSDYWHHPTDVLFGAFLGIMTATFSYHQYYPVVTSPRSDRPFDPRKASLPILPVDARDYHGNHHHREEEDYASPNHIYLSPTATSNSNSNSNSSNNNNNSNNNSEAELDANGAPLISATWSERAGHR